MRRHDELRFDVIDCFRLAAATPPPCRNIALIDADVIVADYATCATVAAPYFDDSSLRLRYAHITPR